MAAITGKFLADFESFYTAVEQANVSLDGFEANASTVERKLDSMVNAFSGTKIIQQATLATEAVKLLGDGTSAVSGAAKLTEAEQAKLNATLTEAIAKYTALGQTAPKEMLELAKATATTAAATDKLAKAAGEAPQGAASSWVGDFTSQVTSMAAGMISAQAVIGGIQTAFSSFVSLVGSSIESFAGAEAAAKRVDVALAGISQATPRASGYMQDLAAQFQNTTKYSDDLVNEMQALLIQVGQVMPSDMEAALTAATNLASGLGIDLQQATEKVAQAFAGNTEGLKKYGITIDEVKVASEGMPYVLDEINKRFGGQAAAELDTYSGKVANLANKWDNVKEKIGEVVVNSPFLGAALAALEEQMNKTGGAAKDMSHYVSESVREGGFKGYADAIRWLEDLAGAYVETGRVRKEFEQEKPSENVSIRIGTQADWSRSLATTNAELAKGAEENKKKEKTDREAAQATDQHANAVKSLREQLSGDGAVKQAQLYVEALGNSATAAKLNAEAQKQIADALWKGIEAYRTQGKEVPPIMAEIYASVAKIPPVIQGTLDAFANVGKVALPSIQSIIGPMEAAAKAAADYEAETRRQVDAWNESQKAAKGAADATNAVANETQRATQTVVQLAAATQALTAAEETRANRALYQEYSKAGVAMGMQIATGGYTFAQLQRGIQQGWTPGSANLTYDDTTTPWGTGAGSMSTTNTLNINVNNEDAQGIANKLVTEMRHNGYRM